MSHVLVIVESPAKAKTIAKFLGKEFDVLASFGHVRDLPQTAAEIPPKLKKQKWARLGVDVEHDYAPLYVIPADKKKRIAELKRSLERANRVLLATDEDREGESISWHLAEILKPKVPVERIVFHEITKDAILAALDAPRTVDAQLVRAQETRRILDRLFGYTLSPILWKKVQPKLSAGRVQSVAVRLLVLRERERIAFRSAAYWGVEATCESQGTPFTATLERLGGARIATGRDFDPETGMLKIQRATLLDGARAGAVADALAGGALTVADVATKEAKRSPGPPFTTATLQQAANRRLGFSAKRTMQLAQQLYEGIDLGGGERAGLITYMRTDSVTLSKQCMAQAQEVIAKLFGKDATPGPRQYRTTAKGAQEAHEAIRPTDLRRTPASLSGVLDRELLRLYELIWVRTIASQMHPARIARTTATFTAPTPEGEATLVARGQSLVDPGYLRAYVFGKSDPAAALEDEDAVLPVVTRGQSLPVRAANATEHATQPPARYTEASLVKKLEAEGIGRPSTYATILSTIQDRGYCMKQGSALVPTFTAFAVTELLERHFGDLVDVRFTARMEEALDEIAAGNRDALAELRAFYEGGGEGAAIAPRVEREQELIQYPSMDVGGGAVVKVGRFGAYVQHASGARATIPEELAPADLTEEKIAMLLKTSSGAGGHVLGTDPETGLEITVRSGRFGPYVQLGPDPEEDGEKPRRATIRKPLVPERLTLDDALALLAFPRQLGAHPSTGEVVTADRGRYGPYVRCGAEFRSVPPEKDVATITLDEALALLAAPKTRGVRTPRSVEPLRTLGTDPQGRIVKVFAGRYGPYVSDGRKIYASLGRGMAPESVTLEQGIELLAAKAEKGPSARRGASRGPRRAAKAPARRSAPKKRRRA